MTGPRAPFSSFFQLSSGPSRQPSPGTSPVIDEAGRRVAQQPRPEARRREPLHRRPGPRGEPADADLEGSRQDSPAQSSARTFLGQLRRGRLHEPARPVQLCTSLPPLRTEGPPLLSNVSSGLGAPADGVPEPQDPAGERPRDRSHEVPSPPVPVQVPARSRKPCVQRGRPCSFHCGVHDEAETGPPAEGGPEASRTRATRGAVSGERCASLESYPTASRAMGWGSGGGNSGRGEGSAGAAVVIPVRSPAPVVRPDVGFSVSPGDPHGGSTPAQARLAAMRARVRARLAAPSSQAAAMAG